jgi:hypothetical protein
MGGGVVNERVVTIRPVRTQDAAGLADAWTEFGRYYADLDPVLFRVPEPTGLTQWVEEELEAKARAGSDHIWLVAERDGVLIGYVQARIKRPGEHAEKQLLRDVG